MDRDAQIEEILNILRGFQAILPELATKEDVAAVEKRVAAVEDRVVDVEKRLASLEHIADLFGVKARLEEQGRIITALIPTRIAAVPGKTAA